MLLFISLLQFTDEQMLKLDPQLAAVFKSMMKGKKKIDKKSFFDFKFR